MVVMIFLLILLLAAAGAAAPILYSRNRTRLQELKSYERGLKMVPLLIHLPPPSEDNEGGGRDARDVIDENISKAQVIYNIIASTVQDDKEKAKLYGQRHIAFEIIGSKGSVHFYTAVPISLIEVVKQAIVSAYPSARLEEVPEHNVFNPRGKLSGTTGGELKLKEDFAYPIATYQDTKRDAMEAILNALSTLEDEDGVSIQILLRPADDQWRKTAKELASKKRKGKDDKKKAAEQLLSLGKDVATAFVKPPEAKDDKKDDKKKELSNLEQSVLDSIDEKTRYPGYEVIIRIVSSSNVAHRSQAVLNNIIAAFSLFDAPGRNGFKFSAAKDIEEFLTSYILRLFPATEKENILNAVELATLFHFPDQRSIPTSQLERQGSKQVDGPRNIPDDGLLLGYNIFRGNKKPIRLGIHDRQRHMYAVGQTGTGKTTFLENLAFQDMLRGGGFAFVDPHGDVAERLMALVPKERTEDIIYFCPSETDYPMGLNLFEYSTNDQKDFLIQEVLNMLYKLYDPQHQGIMGPRYEHLFRNAALTVMADPNGGTFVDIPKLFRDPQFVKQKLQYVKDQNVIEFWQKEMPQSQRSNEFGEVVSWFVSKFGAFLSNEMMRNIIGQTKSAFDLRDIMDNNKILLVNLSKGKTGELNSKLLGMIFVMKFQAAAMSRASIPESERKDFALYVDEFQNFSTDSFATILSEARKYHLNLIVANQFTTQLTDEIREAVFGNVGTIVTFRVGDHDVDSLAKYFSPTFDGADLLRIPNHNTVVRSLIGGVPTNPFSMSTIPPLGSPNYQLADALKQLSAAKYGRPKAKVEAEIFKRLATAPEPPKPAPAPGRFGGASPFGANPAPGVQSPRSRGGAASYRPQPNAPFSYPPAAPAYGPQQAPPQSAMPPVPKPAASFLDDWMHKRQGPPATRPAMPQPQFAPQYPQAPTAPALSHHNTPFAAPPAPAYGPQQAPPQSAMPPVPNGQAQQPFGGRNISSDNMQDAEVDTIAQKLKHDLKKTHHRRQAHKQEVQEATIVTPQAVTPHAPPKTYTPSSDLPPDPLISPAVKPTPEPITVKPEPIGLAAVPPSAPKPTPDAGEISLQQPHNAEDTIFIDQEGNLRGSNDA